MPCRVYLHITRGANTYRARRIGLSVFAREASQGKGRTVHGNADRAGAAGYFRFYGYGYLPGIAQAEVGTGNGCWRWSSWPVHNWRSPRLHLHPFG